MHSNIKTIKSYKNGISSIESYIIVRDNVSYLRVLGQEPNWTIITATASEDYGGVSVCADQQKIIEAAFIFCKLYGAAPILKKDWAGRDYAVIGSITRSENETNDDFEREYANTITEFFDIFDHA
jgi:hypothetical protein